MQPTDSLFIWLMVAVTALVLIGTIVGVPRLWKRGWTKYVVQGVSVILTALLLLLTAVVILNKENNWYPSWGSLTGNPADETVVQKVFGASPESKATAHIRSAVLHEPSELQADIHNNPELGAHIPADTSQGAYIPFTLDGQVSGETYDVLVWLPASYFQDKNRFFPVIMAFPGYPGSPQTYVSDLQMGQRINDAVATGDMQDAVVVIPDVMPGTTDTECVDGTQGGKNSPAHHTETFIAQDLVGWIQQNLRTIDEPGAWATSGYSAGGWCSSMIAVRHPDIFGASLNQSGYFAPIYSNGQQRNNQNDSRYLLAERVKEDKPNVNIYFFASDDDPLAMEDLPGFVAAVTPPTSVVVETIRTGGHRADVWKIGIDLGLKHLGQDLKYFAPLT